MSRDGRERWNIPQRPEWIDERRELLYVTGKAEIISSLCPLKRLKDSTYYEDFFIRQLRSVLKDYGLDGFHGADGYAHPRIPVYNGDFSGDMIEQFMRNTNITVPNNTIPKRADWILKYAGGQWRDFYAWRQQRFWEKTVNMLNSINRSLIFNTAWTRYPFEAKYRYGIDCLLLMEVGVDKFIVEVPAAVVELEGWKVKTGEFTEILLIRNDCPYYASVEIDINTPIKSVAIQTGYPALPIAFKAGTLYSKIAPNGIAV